MSANDCVMNFFTILCGKYYSKSFETLFETLLKLKCKIQSENVDVCNAPKTTELIFLKFSNDSYLKESSDGELCQPGAVKTIKK